MKIESLHDDFAQVIKRSAGLRLYLNNLNKGRAATPRSWLYENKAADDVLASWLVELEKVKTIEHGDLVYQYDISRKKKWGPQGAVPPLAELMDTIKASYNREGTPKPSVFNSSLWKQAKANVVRKWFIQRSLYKKLRPRALAKVVDDMASRDTLSSNSGFPSFTRRNNPWVKAKAIRDAESGKAYEYPAIVLFRNYKQKTRMVWMYPMSMNLVEGSYTQPLKEALTSLGLDFLSPWRGYEDVKLVCTYQYDKGHFMSASDFSHTDEYFTRWMMFEVYDVIKWAFQEKYWPGLKKSMLHVNSIPLLIGEDSIIYGDHGVSSGSNWTNDVETYMDRICEEYMLLKDVVNQTGIAIGDDVNHFSTCYYSKLADRLAKEYTAIGFDVNAEKVTNERDYVIFLQRLMVRGYYSEFNCFGGKVLRGIYSTVWALCTSLYPEKFHSPKLWSKKMFATRQFMILENCIDHPLFKEFVKFVCDGNRYLYEFAMLSNDNLLKAQRKSHLIPGFNPTYNQEKRNKSLAEFESIRIARELASKGASA